MLINSIFERCSTVIVNRQFLYGCDSQAFQNNADGDPPLNAFFTCDSMCNGDFKMNAAGREKFRDGVFWNVKKRSLAN